jgi:hypothetical protein
MSIWLFEFTHPAYLDSKLLIRKRGPNYRACRTLAMVELCKLQEKSEEWRLTDEIDISALRIQ